MKKLLFLVTALFFVSHLSSQSVSVISQTNIPCFGMCNGAVSFSVSGGVPPYSAVISNGGGCSNPTVTPFNSTVTVNGFCACPSAYSFLFFDSGANLMGVQNVNFTSPTAINATPTTTNICCFGLCNGVIKYFVSGGTPSYSYTWQPFGGPGSVSSNLCAGNYSMMVKDGNGCTATFTNSITQPPILALSLTVAPTTCTSCCNGQVVANPSGGTPSYQYNLNGGTYGPVNTFTNLCNGVYTVCIKDGGCCIACGTVAVTTNTAAGINNLNIQESRVDVFPNPSNGNIQLLFSGEKSPMNYEVYDVLGDLVSAGKVEEKIDLDLSINGIYELRIIKNNSVIITRKKLLIQKE